MYERLTRVSKPCVALTPDSDPGPGPHPESCPDPNPVQVMSRTLLFGLEQQRRPPLEGVWLIKEVLPLEQTLFQVINKGSTEEW